jgi:6-hydroxycyclohex-1-ene-1-carbonyl-CoA dehydrogenase
MRAAVFRGPGKALALEDVADPQAGPGDVVVRVAACGLCRTDLHYLHGTPTFRKPPLVLGHEISGVVEAIGEGEEAFAEGDRVLVPPVFSCGRCPRCREGRGTLCRDQIMLGNHRDGGFAERVAVPADQIFRLPEEVPLREGCIVSDALSTPYHAVVNRAAVRPGQQVAIFGCGGVGLAAVQMAALAGGSVVAVDLLPAKLAKAKEFGAVETVNASEAEDVAKAVRRATGGGADVALEVIGNPATIEQAFRAVRPGGRVVVVGFSAKDVALNAGRLMFREIEILGSLGCGLQDFPRLLELVRTGRLRVAPLVTHRFPLEAINEGFRLLEEGHPDLIRGIVVPGEETA